MKFCGYEFTIEKDIKFDEELTLKKLDLEIGDIFYTTVDEKTGQVILKRERQVQFDLLKPLPRW